MSAGSAADIAIVSLGSTGGWRAADRELQRSLERAGASVVLAECRPPRAVRTLMLTDLGWARAARRAALEALRRARPGAVIYSSTTAALLWPRPGAIRFDSPAAGNRPGRHGLWQRPLERRRLRQAPLLLPMSTGALGECGRVRQGGHGEGPAALVLPIPVEPSGPPEGPRDIAAVTYAANPAKKGTAEVLEAWLRARRSGEKLVVAGCEAADIARAGIALPQGSQEIEVVGSLPPPAYRALLRRARLFVCAPRWEDYGIAQLEALADGCVLVSTAGRGPYVALAPARTLDPRLVVPDGSGAGRLAEAIRTALDEPASGYAQRASALLAPFTPAAIDRVVAAELLPRLLGAARARAGA